MSTPDELDSLHLSPAEAQALLRMIEAAPEVRRRYQFFNWLQGQVHPLLRHHVALCGAYSRVRRQLLFEVFNSVPLSPGALQQLASPGSRLLQHLAQAWVQGEARPQVRALADVAQAAPGDELQALAAAGVQQLMVHGVSLPDRPHELVTLFVLAGDGPAPRDGGTHLGRLLELAVHPMHAALLRMLSFERELGAQPVRAAPGPAVPVVQRTPRVTAREAQILSWVREGMNNQQIGTELGISALTVKNHIQKILRKLGASNRAHAVALAMQWRLLNDDGPASGFGSLGSGA